MAFSSFAPRIFKIGLTGGIASGKSSVLRVIARANIPTIDCDKLGHNAYRPGTRAHRRVVETFGEDIVKDDDGFIDRTLLGQRVFGNSAMMHKLNSIVWPSIEELAREEMLRLQDSGEKIVVMEAAILIEASWHKMMDEVWLVEVPPSVALQRQLERGIPKRDALARVRSQMPSDARRAFADFVIDTFTLTKEENEKRICERIDLIRQKIAARSSAGSTTDDTTQRT